MRALTITSGKGGVGKTNISVNLALALADAGARVLLLDADMSLANTDVILGLSPSRTLFDLLQGTPVDDVLVAVSPGLDLLPASSGLLKLERLTHAERLKIGGQLDALSDRYDWLLIDTGAGLTQNVLFFNSLADGVMLVTVPEPTSITDTYAMLKVLVGMRGVGQLGLLVNNTQTAAAAQQVHDRLGQVSARFLHVDLPLVGHIPSDPQLPRAVQARTPVLRFAPEALCSRAFRQLARHATSVYGQCGDSRGFWRAWADGHPELQRVSGQR